ncbi:hypothetical protein E3Q02_00362 [Wallemia mellicola]|uniref:F-box domain-containing protein n=1 Tax=Wallemia mellicola TaxID=1708541 RepID=A0AB38N1I9_9BASI|nr:hypothetical protein E3Q02_00362 [Wallemia mellicola]
MKQLPNEIWVGISSMLDLETLKSFALSCKQFNAIFNSVEIQYRYYLEIYNYCDKTKDTPEAIYKRLTKLKNLQNNLNNFNAQQHHVLVRDHKSALQAKVDPNGIPYRKRELHSSLRVLRDGYFIVSSHGNTFELYKLPKSDGESTDKELNNVSALYPSVVKLELGERYSVQDFDLDVENDLIVCCIKEHQENRMLQFYFHFFSLSAALNTKHAVQHPIASTAFTHNLLRASAAASFQIQLNGPHLAVQFNEREHQSLVTVWDWTKQMALEAVYSDNVNLCEAAAFLTSDILALAVVVQKTGNPVIQCVQLDPTQQQDVAKKYEFGVQAVPSGVVDSGGFRILSEFQMYNDGLGSRKHVPFIFAEPVVSHTTDASLNNIGSIQPTEESGFLCIEVVTLDNFLDGIFPATFIVQKKKLLDNLVERNPIGYRVGEDGEGTVDGSFPAEFLSDSTRVTSEPKSVYPMYGTRFCNVPKINMIELIDFNPRLKYSKPDKLDADMNALVEGRQRRLNRYIDKHLSGNTLTEDSYGEPEMLEILVNRLRNGIDNLEQEAGIGGRPHQNPAHPGDDNDNSDDDDFLDGESVELESDESFENMEMVEGEGEEREEAEGEEEEEEEEDDLDNLDDIGVMQEIDISDVSDEEERNMENLQPGGTNESTHAVDQPPERQVLVKGSKQSLDISVDQNLVTYSDKSVKQTTLPFKLPYRTVISYSDLGIESVMIDKECLILETFHEIFHILTF